MRPPLRRRLIVNADDFGQSVGINDGVARAHQHGIVTSASLMVRWPAAKDAATYAREHPDLSLGLHVDLGEWEFQGDGWTPLYTVVDSDDVAVVEQELRRQLEAFRDLTGRDPTHIDSTSTPIGLQRSRRCSRTWLVGRRPSSGTMRTGSATTDASTPGTAVACLSPARPRSPRSSGSSSHSGLVSPSSGVIRASATTW